MGRERKQNTITYNTIGQENPDEQSGAFKRHHLVHQEPSGQFSQKQANP